MNRLGLGWAVVFWPLLSAATPALGAESAAEGPSARKLSSEESDFFERRIRPVLAEHCYGCHSARASVLQAQLLLDSAAGVRAGGDSGPALVAGKPKDSLLIQAIRYEALEMPPDGKLPDEVIANFERWVEMGAPDPRTSEEGPPKPEPPVDAANHWAFQPPLDAPPPKTDDESWPTTDVDRFILAELERRGPRPSPPAGPRTRLRRLYYDLIGLPPGAEETVAFQQEPSRETYLRAVDSLLALPQFGERWGRHWLDVARYADTKGYVFQEDRNYPKAYTYRDWVIKAFNDDVPYDRFIMAQIAADQMGDATATPATGFLTLGRRFINNKQDIIDDRIDVLCRGVMGLTVTCARCHDHKYDPIPLADYYSLYGVFASSREPGGPDTPLLLADADKPVEPVVFLRGNPANPGPQVPRQFLVALSGPDRKPFRRGSGRLELAQAVASPDNPLTARVWVNRVWGYLFGQGLVPTPSDFGTRSDPPSHPQLLDYLACRFVREGWSTKKLIRWIVTSQVYQQASDEREDGRAADPENRLLWRMNRRRLDLEALRDSLLLAAGRLDKTLGGPSVQITDPPFATRRSVYCFVDRQNLPGLFRTFDFASPDAHTPRRPLTTVPQQALYLMNSPFAIEQATYLANRPEVQQATTDDQRIAALFRCALGRDPSDDETASALAYLHPATQPESVRPAGDDDVWRYGYGQFDASTQRLATFTPLPHFTGSAWQGGPNLPDPALGWVILNAGGGHPGNDQAHAAVRRWLAPDDGSVTIEGVLEHATDKGDGVRGRVVSSRAGVAGEWTVRDGNAATRVQSLAVQAGDTLDLVADCLAEPSFDGFRWTVTVRFDSPGSGARRQWDSAADFRGPQPEPLAPWVRLAQVLLMTNEFAYVD